MAAVSKSILTISSVVLILLFAGGVYLFLNFGSVAKTVSERVASQALGVPVSIGSVEVSFQDKAVTVSRVAVSNPPGYQGKHAATIETIFLKAHTLSQALLNFQDITVRGADVYLEVKPDATNLSDIKKNVNTKAAAGDKAAEQIKVIIEQMRIESLHVNPRVLLVGAPDIKPVTVPDIVLRNIGKRENGVLAREAIAQIWGRISQDVSRAANQAGFYEGISPDALEDLGVGQIESLKQQIKEDMEELGSGLKKLFGGD